MINLQSTYVFIEISRDRLPARARKFIGHIAGGCTSYIEVSKVMMAGKPSKKLLGLLIIRDKRSYDAGRYECFYRPPIKYLPHENEGGSLG